MATACLGLHNTYLCYTVCGTDYYFAYVILPECCSNVCTGVQHSNLIYSWWYNLYSKENTIAIAYTSVMIIFILLLGVIVFHILHYTRLYKCSFVEKAFISGYCLRKSQNENLQMMPLKSWIDTSWRDQTRIERFDCFFWTNNQFVDYIEKTHYTTTEQKMRPKLMIGGA